jgi:hypothetical protein
MRPFVQAGQVYRGCVGSLRWVLRCHPQDQATQFWHRRGPTGLAVRVPPAAFDQVPMPARQCLGRHESMEPMLLWEEEAGQRREDGLVWPGGAWSAELSAQDRDLVAQDEDLGVLGCLRSGQQSEPAEELAEDQVEESERQQALGDRIVSSARATRASVSRLCSVSSANSSCMNRVPIWREASRSSR